MFCNKREIKLHKVLALHKNLLYTENTQMMTNKYNLCFPCVLLIEGL